MAFALCVPTFFILFSTTVSIVLSQSEGDLRLVKTDVIPPLMNYLGRLDIFWKGKWSTVCGLDRGGAQAACRQLGFSDFYVARPYSQINQSYVPRADDDMPIAIRNTNCVYEIPDELNHILRCGYTADTMIWSSNVDQFQCGHTNLKFDWCLVTTPLLVHWKYITTARGAMFVAQNSIKMPQIQLVVRWGTLMQNCTQLHAIHYNDNLNYVDEMLTIIIIITIRNFSFNPFHFLVANDSFTCTVHNRRICVCTQ